MDVLTEVKFWSQILGGAKRTVVCSPELESRVKGWIEVRGMADLLTVTATRWCPDERILILDTPAIAASLAQSTGIKFPLDYRPEPIDYSPPHQPLCTCSHC